MSRQTWFFCLLILTSSGPLAAQSCVWKVTEGGHTLYLGGTIHLLRKADLPPPAEFDVAFEAADALYFETDIARLQSPETLGILMKEGVYPKGQSLKSELSPEAWTAVQDYCKQAKMATEMMERFKPWMFVINVSTLEMMKLGVSEQGVDFLYYQKAVAAGKTVAGLESYEAQIGYLTHIGAGHESEMVLQQLKELGRMQDLLESMIASWRAGDLARIDELLLTEVRTDSPETYEELIVQRNRNWLPELEEMLRSDPVEFVLVGAGHLAGDAGLIAALKQRGCAIEQVVAPR
jgi:uncharacterized protein YbaP (TraB family)